MAGATLTSPARVPYIQVGGAGVQAVTLPQHEDLFLHLAPNQPSFVAELPNGSFIGQRVYVTMKHQTDGSAGAGPWPIRHANGDLDVSDDFGRGVKAGEYPFYRGDSLELVWLPGKNARNRWRPLAPHEDFDRSEKLVFAGCVLAGSTMLAGYRFVPMQVLYDPYNRWNSNNHTYSRLTQRDYRIEISLTRNDLPSGTFTIHRPNSATLRPLPTDNGQFFAYEWTGFHAHSSAFGVGSANTDLGLRLLNATGATVTFANTLLFVQRRYWRVNIYETVTVW